ncbi:winged helix-turn-helix domain-containing protein [Acuticoccus sp. M5D2P5]|uniref:winged helix-turn-helix domain-containing protein n=1 Tax=Acuticoccus kalidii TaxID=2910977 RepID=UPI001F485946|nr:winged helix-turn-helix domain-containing protein [Acuticoccus kalidii]MCF3933315.1 winged helix-turn-helix domain-containing protein [Acuticoccus kalidii]
MDRHAPSRSGIDPERIATAALGLGRLAEAVRFSPMAPAFRLRETAVVAAEMAAQRLGPTRAQDLFAIVAGAPGAYIEAGDELHAALWFWRQGLRAWYMQPLPAPWGGTEPDDYGDTERARDWQADDGAAFHPEITAALARIGPLPPCAGLVARLQAIHRAATRERAVGASDIARVLALRPVTGAVLPCLATIVPPAKTGMAFEPWLARTATRMSRAAETSYERLRALEAAWRRWQEKINPHRASSELPAVLALLAHSPLLTPSAVAASCGVSSRTGLRHLQALEAVGVVREVTGRARWRLYAAADLGLAPWNPRRRRQTESPPAETGAGVSIPPTDPLPPVDFDSIDRMLHDAYHAVDRAMQHVEARLADPEGHSPVGRGEPEANRTPDTRNPSSMTARNPLQRSTP